MKLAAVWQRKKTRWTTPAKNSELNRQKTMMITVCFERLHNASHKGEKMQNASGQAYHWRGKSVIYHDNGARGASAEVPWHRGTVAQRSGSAWVLRPWSSALWCHNGLPGAGNGMWPRRERWVLRPWSSALWCHNGLPGAENGMWRRRERWGLGARRVEEATTCNFRLRGWWMSEWERHFIKYSRGKDRKGGGRTEERGNVRKMEGPRFKFVIIQMLHSRQFKVLTLNRFLHGDEIWNVLHLLHLLHLQMQQMQHILNPPCIFPAHHHHLLPMKESV